MVIVKNFECMQDFLDSHIDTLQTALVNLSIEVQELKREIHTLKERATIQNGRIVELEGTFNPFICGE